MNIIPDYNNSKQPFNPHEMQIRGARSDARAAQIEIPKEPRKKHLYPFVKGGGGGGGARISSFFWRQMRFSRKTKAKPELATRDF